MDKLEPVSFLDAMRVYYEENKTIYSVYFNIIRKKQINIYRPAPWSSLKVVENNNGVPVTAYEILYADWYIGEPK